MEGLLQTRVRYELLNFCSLPPFTKVGIPRLSVRYELLNFCSLPPCTKIGIPRLYTPQKKQIYAGYVDKPTEEEGKVEMRLLEFAKGASALGDNLNESPYPTFWNVSADPFGDYDPPSDLDGEESPYEDEGEMVPYLIWNREAYDGLSRQIEELLQMRYKRFIILGTAGIGKSWFAVVWILKLAIQRCKVVLKQGTQFHILDFTDNSPFVSGPHPELHPLVQAYLRKLSTWLIIDGKQEERLGYRCKILVACSTKPSNFAEFRKHSRAFTLYMPAWRKEEIQKFLRDFEPYREQYSSMHVSEESDAMELFRILGGIPRYVLDSTQAGYGKQQLLRAVTTLALDIETAIQTISGGYVKDLSDRIAHIYSSQDYRSPFYELASDYVCDAIRQQLFTANEIRISSLLVATHDNAQLAMLWGLCFEVQVHRRLSAGGEFRLKKVYPGGCDATAIVSVSPHTMKQVKRVDNIKGLVAAGTYLLPMQGNFPTADAFLGLRLIQVFKRKPGEHGYEVSGLVKLDKELGLNKYELWSCVPPELFDVTGFQDYVTIEDKLYKGKDKATLAVLHKCEQYVCEIDYHTLN